jgi:hypothetical protein
MTCVEACPDVSARDSRAPGCSRATLTNDAPARLLPPGA